MDNKLKEYNETVFEDIKHTDEYGNEYWLIYEQSKCPFYPSR